MRNSGMARLLAMFGMGNTMKAPKDSKDVQDKHEGVETIPHWWGHQPIHPLNRSQKAKGKRLIASNRRQGRA
jgi:hypothetical protein